MRSQRLFDDQVRRLNHKGSSMQRREVLLRIPPPLLQQVKPNGVMVIPVGPSGAQHILEVRKVQRADGGFAVARSGIYHGSTINFVPFTRLVNGSIDGTRSSGRGRRRPAPRRAIRHNSL